VTRTRWIVAAGAVALVATAAIGEEAEQAQPQAASRAAPATMTPRVATAAPRQRPNIATLMPRALPASVLLPQTQALFDAYVADRKMPGIVAAYGLGRLPTLYPAAAGSGSLPMRCPPAPIRCGASIR
jgi:hypothetical protein